VDPLDGIRALRLREAEHIPALGISPRVLEAHTLVGLDGQWHKHRATRLSPTLTSDHSGMPYLIVERLSTLALSGSLVPTRTPPSSGA
jgi:hypothetical protein